MSTTTSLQDQEAIEKFREMAKEVNICMFTTIGEDHQLSSRPMFTADVDEEANVWFFTNEFSEKINEVSKDNIVHLIYAHPARNIYLDVSGTCSLIIDRKKMEELWDSSMTKWFPEGLDDARICLVKVSTETAHYWNHQKTKMGLMFQLFKSIAKGDKYHESENGKLNLSTPPQEK
jgi:general stress protein 26